MAERVLTQRELNRALLARQMLLERVSMPVLDAVEKLAGMQSQIPVGPYIGLWSRLINFERDDLATLIENRHVVKATLMRGTLHFFTTDDYVRFRIALQPALTALTESYARSHHLSVGFDPIVSAAREFFRDEPRTVAELAKVLTSMYSNDDRITLTNVVRGMLPIIQVPISGRRWSYPPNVKWALAEEWIGKALETADNFRDLVWRYLAAFGPATIADIRAWSGLPNLKERMQPLKSDLVIYRDEKGRELLDLPEMPLPDANTPAPVRFIGDLDNLLLAHHDRSRVLPEAYRQLAVSQRYMGRAFLIDGMVRGSWVIEKTKPAATLMIEPFEPIDAADCDALIAEGERLVRFTHPEAVDINVIFAEPN